KGGTGLGLNISKSIIEKHGGRMGFDSETGAGATFYFDLPEPAAGQGAAKTAPQAAGLRALICEDDRDIAEVLSAMLENDGFCVDIAYSAEEAKARLQAENYDVMTVDIMLPGQDGLSLIRELRENEKTRNLAMVVISAKAEQARLDVLEATLGIVDWIEKPISQDHLAMAVRRAVQGNGGGKAKVLYVEDDVDLSDVTTALLEGMVNLIHAATLEEAKKELRNGRFDLVIIDISLPDGSGLDLLELVKDDGQRLTPVIIFSGQDVSAEISGKAEAVLVKSRTSNEKLVKTIKSLILERTPERIGAS
ncbi:MAG TPA: hybrid sensor histidine kinase/response regulator, partial [Rhodospirillales bacterium]|nr:hybrid sensor histidine kinase/response regulator [Rhodospirillales bacterium]